MEDERRQKAAAPRAKKALTLLPRQQKYASQSLRELTEKLFELSERQKSGQLSTELCDIVYVLKAQRLRSPSNAHAFRSCGGVKTMLRLLRVCKEAEWKGAPLVLGTLGNLCALEEGTRSEVIQDGTGLSNIVSALGGNSSSACLNTAARVIGNLAVDAGNVAILRELGVVKELNHIIASHTADSDSKQSTLRSLRILCADAECREELKNADNLLALSACLKSEDDALVQATLQVVAVLTQDSDSDTIQLLCNHGAMPHVVRLSQHNKAKVWKEAINIILRCCKNSDGRVALGSSGGMETLVRFLEKTHPEDFVFREVTCALCMCCRDVISRQRLRDCGGLEQLIGMLSKAEFASMHGNLLSALICYYFDENTLKYMVKRLGLLRALTYQLQEMTGKAVHPDSSEQQVEMTREMEEVSGGGQLNDDECGVRESTDTESTESVKSLQEDVTSTSEEDAPHAPPTQSESDLDSESYSCVGSLEQDEVVSLPSDVSSASTAELPLSAEEQFSESDSLQSNLGDTELGLDNPLDQPAVATPTSPPAKRPKLQLDFDSSTPMPTNFIDSLLSSPIPYQSPQTIAEASPLPTELATTQETQVILLLSRVSHLRDCLLSLSSQDVLKSIISYYFSLDYPNVHVFKVLTRVFMNPHCFQDCLLARVPSTIYSYLSLPESISGLEQQPLALLRANLGSSPSSPWSSRQASPLYYCYSPIHFSPSVVPNSSPAHHPSSPTQATAKQSFYGMSWELLERLSKIAESPYGQGVLAHMLLRGEQREKQASSLAIPILCRSVRVCHKLMLSFKGLQLLIGFVTVAEETNFNLQMLAIDSFLRLASNLDRVRLKRKRSASEDALGFLPPAKRSRTDSQENSITEEQSTAAGPSCQTTTPKTFGKSVTCRYRDSDHRPFDLILRVSNGRVPTETVRLPVHRHILRESSDLFSVMLGENYKESAETEVDIRDVPLTAMASIVHYIYGCGWLCACVVEEVTHPVREEEGRATSESPASATTEAIIEEAVSVFDFNEEQQLARHGLEVLATASRFLLSDLCTHSELFTASYITPKNVVPIFQFAQLHQSCYLAQVCIQQVVSMAHSQLQRKVFKDLITSTEGAEALRMFEAFILTRL